MGQKANDEHTPEQHAAPPLNDDARWLPIEAAHQRRAERTADNGLAIIDLEKALVQDHLPCMARSTVTGERRSVTPSDWTDQIRLVFWKGRVCVFPGDQAHA